MPFPKHILCCLLNLLLQRYDSAIFCLILKKRLFSPSRQLYTVILDGVGGGPILNQHVWDG